MYFLLSIHVLVLFYSDKRQIFLLRKLFVKNQEREKKSEYFMYMCMCVNTNITYTQYIHTTKIKI